jgi:hypothetical protein
MFERKHARAVHGRQQSAASGFAVICFLLLGGLSRAQETAPSEYQVKAAFLYKFTRFVEWPIEAFPSPSAPFVLGVIGDNPFGPELDRAVKGKDVNGHPFVVKEIKNVTDAKMCQMLFISSSERRRLPQILSALGTLPVLTVSETDRFLASGGIINLFMDENKVHFEISDATAKRAGLRISSKLLYLARPRSGAK